MNERTTLEKIGPTVDDAVSAGLEELGLAAEMVDVEVLDSGSARAAGDRRAPGTRSPECQGIGEQGA